MPSTTSKSAFRRGLQGGVPYILVVAPFGLLFGVVATESGLDLAETMAFSVLVIAGAAQFTAVGLLTENASAFLALAAALGVNLRNAMYSASLVPHLGPAPFWQRALISFFIFDQNFASAALEYEKRPTMSVAEKMAFITGVTIPIAPTWYVSTYLGAVLGATIPPEYALDFALPLMFVALAAPALRSAPHVVAATVAIVVALLATGMPSGMGVLLAGILGMMAGAQAELWLRARA